MSQHILEHEITFSNQHFWHWFIALLRGFDEEKELNLDEAIEEKTGLDLYSKEIETWYRSFFT